MLIVIIYHITLFSIITKDNSLYELRNFFGVFLIFHIVFNIFSSSKSVIVENFKDLTFPHSFQHTQTVFHIELLKTFLLFSKFSTFSTLSTFSTGFQHQFTVENVENSPFAQSFQHFQHLLFPHFQQFLFFV